MRNGELLLQGVRAFASLRLCCLRYRCYSLLQRRWLRYLCCNRQACAEFGFRRLLAAAAAAAAPFPRGIFPLPAPLVQLHSPISAAPQRPHRVHIFGRPELTVGLPARAAAAC